MMRFTILFCLFSTAGCGDAPSPEEKATPIPSIADSKPSTPSSEKTVLDPILRVIANQLKIAEADIGPNATFASIGADELDLVEITMAVEDALGIAIRDDALSEAAGVGNEDALCKHLTISTFTTVAAKAPKQTIATSSAGTAKEGVLQDAQWGKYALLSQLTNPDGLVLIFIPSIELLSAQAEQRLGRKLSGSEVEELRQQAAVMAVTRDVADELKQQQAERESAAPT